MLTTLFSTLIVQSLLVVLAVIFVDAILGVMLSIKTKTFSLSILPDFLVSNIFPYVGGLIVLALLSVYMAELEYLYWFAATVVTAKFSKEALLDKITALFS